MFESSYPGFVTAYLFCRTVQPGLNKLLFNIILVEGRPSLESDLNIVAAIFAIRQPPALWRQRIFFFVFL